MHASMCVAVWLSLRSIESSILSIEQCGAAALHFHQYMVFTLFHDSLHSIVLCVLILFLFNVIFNSINCEKNA